MTALANGAAAVEAFGEPEDARHRAREIGALTAGERHAHRIDGFDLGNSPLEFTRERVQGRVICATTTNGTRALLAAAGASRIFVAGLVNLSATVEAIRVTDASVVHLICAGTDGHESLEDTACADAIAAALRDETHALTLDARRNQTHTLSLNARRSQAHALALDALRKGPHATLLAQRGYERDVEYCLTLDSLPLAVEADADGVCRRVPFPTTVSERIRPSD